MKDLDSRGRGGGGEGEKPCLRSAKEENGDVCEKLAPRRRNSSFNFKGGGKLGQFPCIFALARVLRGVSRPLRCPALPEPKKPAGKTGAPALHL